MDWLRRNWPDLAIGVALVGVIAGIVATLVTGGSFFPVGPTTQPPAAIAPATSGDATGPAVPGDDPVADEPAPVGAVSVLTPDGAEPADVTTQGATPATEAPAAETPAADTAAAEAPAADAAPAPSGLAAPTATQPAAEPAAAAAATPPAATPTPTPVAPAPAPAPTGPLPNASSDAEAPYRVSVGAFGNADNAERLAATFRGAGYPVFTGEQGALTIVLVGPYAAESDAQQVAARIAAGGFGIDPVVYRFRPDAPTPGASTPAPGAAAPVAAPAAAPAPAPAAAPAAAVPPAPTPIATASSGRSLQVGAFADAGSAGPLQERLATVGLRAFEVREDGLTKLLVGPFDADGLAAARARLAELGIESFPR